MQELVRPRADSGNVIVVSEIWPLKRRVCGAILRRRKPPLQRKLEIQMILASRKAGSMFGTLERQIRLALREIPKLRNPKNISTEAKIKRGSNVLKRVKAPGSSDSRANLRSRNSARSKTFSEFNHAGTGNIPFPDPLMKLGIDQERRMQRD